MNCGDCHEVDIGHWFAMTVSFKQPDKSEIAHKLTKTDNRKRKSRLLTDWQRSKEPPRQANRTRRRTGGTVAFGLRSKSKCLAQQGLFTNSEKYAFLLLIRRK